MNVLETASQAISVIQQALPTMKALVSLIQGGQAILGSSRFSYENLLLDLTLDIGDESGRRAIVRRKQQVRFLANEAGVLRSSFWGDGDQVLRHRSSGATRLGSRTEGSQKVLLLGLERPARKGSVVEVQTTETVSDALLGQHEYFEAAVERPTRRLRMRVVFPAGRSPQNIYLNAGSGVNQLKLPMHRNANGRPTVGWSLSHARIDTLYSLRWTW
jgi:hypothetical protein